MERKGGEEGSRGGEGRVSVQEHNREGAQDREIQLESKKNHLFTDFVCPEPLQSLC